MSHEQTTSKHPRSHSGESAHSLQVRARIKSTAPLSLLYLEDNPRDRLLVSETLRADGLPCRIVHTSDQAEFHDAIKKCKFDIIISDFSLPSYNGLAALDAAKKVQPDTPFLFVSGTIGDERAVESLKSGANDYVLKDNLERLAPAVRRALREAQERERCRVAEDSLRESETRFRQLAENIDSVFWLLDLRRNQILYVNPAFESIWGRPCEDLLRDQGTWLDGIHADDRSRVSEALRSRQALGVFDESYRVVRPDGTVRWVRERAYPIRNDSGKVYRIAGTAEDITEQRLLEERFRQSQKMEAIGQLAGGVAHDFNNLLTVMRGNSELILMDGASLPAKTRENLKQIIEATQRAANLTRQLLAFSRKQNFQPQPLDLNQLVANLVKMLRRLIGEDIELKFHQASSAVFVQADPGMLEQVLMNLVVNARDAISAGGKITISTDHIHLAEESARLHPDARPGLFACLSVTDTGSGIAPELLPRIFEPFFTTKAAGKGTGLGLATVYGFVKQHLGWVEVTSRVGSGATFKAFLPAIPRPAAFSTESALSPAPRGGKETILLVEDDGPVRLLTRRTLEAFGYRVLEAASGREALKIWSASASEIALVLTDLVMPDGVSGRELAAVLRCQNPNIRVILMSGYASDETATASDDPGAKNFILLQKPYRSSALVDTVRHCLDSAK